MALGPTIAQENCNSPTYPQSHPLSDRGHNAPQVRETESNIIRSDEGQAHAIPPEYETTQSLNIVPLSSDYPPHAWQPSRDEGNCSDAPNNLSQNDLRQTLHQQPQMTSRKRAPKAPTMTAKRWKPCEARIKELYVHHGKSLRELREIVNKEFSLDAKLVFPNMY